MFLLAPAIKVEDQGFIFQVNSCVQFPALYCGSKDNGEVDVCFIPPPFCMQEKYLSVWSYEMTFKLSCYF